MSFSSRLADLGHRPLPNRSGSHWNEQRTQEVGEKAGRRSNGHIPQRHSAVTRVQRSTISTLTLTPPILGSAPAFTAEHTKICHGVTAPEQRLWGSSWGFMPLASLVYGCCGSLHLLCRLQGSHFCISRGIAAVR